MGISTATNSTPDFISQFGQVNTCVLLRQQCDYLRVSFGQVVMFTKFQLVKDLIRDLMHDAATPRFSKYSGDGFSLRRSRSFGTETVWLQYDGRGSSVEIEAIEGRDGGLLVELDSSAAVERLDDPVKAQLAADIYAALQSHPMSSN
jgi:hypothetical protein